MEKIAFISDIHSNLPALDATLVHIKKQGIEKIYCLGDIVGYHTFPNEVIELLQKSGVISIKGNHDEVVVLESFDRDKEQHFPFGWNFDMLTSENISYLKTLPGTIQLEVEGVVIDLVHGSPESISEYIKEGSEELDKYITKMEGDVLMCAHTHVPYIVERGGKFLLNTGSVGKPKFGRPEASYLVLTIDGKEITPEIKSLPYAVDQMTDHLKKHSFPEKLITALETGLP